MHDFDHRILQCPITGEDLFLVDELKVKEILKNPDVERNNLKQIQSGFLNDSRSYFYPIIDDIILLLPIYAFYVGGGKDIRSKMMFDKARVFNYYNEITYSIKNGYKIYQDSPKWVDYRAVSSHYIKNSFTRTKQHLKNEGKYLLDIASGPIGLEEYLALSENFEFRVCIDISVNALIQAKLNYTEKKGLFICGDITNIPLKENVCDSVLCQHTLYHIPKNEQEKAVNELYRVANNGSKIAIVYSLFLHSWFMNITLFPIQLYRIARHIAGKIYVRIFNSKPRLYFYPHSLGWFKRKFSFSEDIKFYCWRSTNKYFMNLYIHKWLFGRKILNRLRKSEEKYPKFWGRIGEYPVIVIKKVG